MTDPFENHDESRFQQDAHDLAHALQNVANALTEASQNGYQHLDRVQQDLDYYVDYSNQLMNAAATHNSQYHDAFNTAAWKVAGAQHQAQEVNSNEAAESKKEHAEAGVADLNESIAALSR